MATPKNQSVVKAFSLLQAFSGPDEWLSSAELSRRAKLPQASGYRIVQTLEDIGAIVRDDRGRYRPGMLLLDLSQDIAPGEIWSQASAGVLQALALELRVTAHVGILETGMVTYVAKADGGPSPLRTRVGTQLEAYSTALGKVLLAALPDSGLHAFLDEGDLVPLTEHTITDRTAFLQAIWRVRAQGWAFDDRETSDDICCLAAPIRNPSGRIVAAISASDAPASMTEARRGEVLERLAAAARAIGARLYRKPDGAGALAGAPGLARAC